jgi:hypothetical protein
MGGRARRSSAVSESTSACGMPPEGPTPHAAAIWNVVPTDPLRIVRTAIRRALGPLRLCGSVTAAVRGCPRGVAPVRPSRALRDNPMA